MGERIDKIIYGLPCWLLCAVVAIILMGCATNPVPGGVSYGITVTTEQNTLMVGKGGKFSYGHHLSRKFGIDGGGGSRGLDGFRDFHVLKLSWTTALGVERTEVVDIGPLINRLQDERNIRKFGKGLRTLLVEIHGERLVVSYEIVPFQRHVPKKGSTTTIRNIREFKRLT